ncbi:MAG TPA: hypothetical protein VFI28_04810 [Candidatus Limnocylindrales bacterium]|nr:hypothetical protein [Candidatus Limnocylindrales bacterium]
MEEASPWRAVALVFTESEAGWRTANGLRGRTRRVAGATEVATIVDQLRAVPDAVSAWSDGSASLHLVDVRLAGRPIVSMSPTSPDRLWVGPEDVRPEIDGLGRLGRVDSVIVVWPSDGHVPLCGWGCSIGPSGAARGSGFSSIVSDEWRDHARRPFPMEGFVHEWLHQVEGALQQRGVGPDAVPSLHAAEVLTSCRSEAEPPFGQSYRRWHDRNPAGHSWQEWYGDWMTGRVRRPDGRGCFGLTPDLWRLARTGFGSGR